MIPPPGSPAAAEPPSTLPDIRSLFLGFHYSLAKLPDTPMRPRVADPRIGYFGTDVWDFTTDDRRIPIVHYVNRWRLEKKDPTAALSEPKQPIVFWIDRTVPDKYRAAIRDGVLEWNKAFERIGYKDAIKVEIQPDDAEVQHVRHPPRVDPLDDHGAQRLRRDRAHRSSIRAPARSSTPTSASTPTQLPRASRASAPRAIPPRPFATRIRRRRRIARTPPRRPSTRPSRCRCSKRAAR